MSVPSPIPPTLTPKDGRQNQWPLVTTIVTGLLYTAVLAWFGSQIPPLLLTLPFLLLCAAALFMLPFRFKLQGISGLIVTYGLAFLILMSAVEARHYEVHFRSQVVKGLLFFLLFAISQLSTEPSLRANAKRWIFGLCLGLGIALLSGKEGGAGGMTSWFLEVFHLTQEQAELIVHIVRKVFHFIFYGTIAATFTSIGTAMSLEFRKAALFGASWATIHALFDEIRQSLSPGRSGSAIDLLIDAAGMAVFLLIAAKLSRRAARCMSA